MKKIVQVSHSIILKYNKVFETNFFQGDLFLPAKFSLLFKYIFNLSHNDQKLVYILDILKILFLKSHIALLFNSSIYHLINFLNQAA